MYIKFIRLEKTREINISLTEVHVVLFLKISKITHGLQKKYFNPPNSYEIYGVTKQREKKPNKR